jgi:hypothetical protein
MILSVTYNKDNKEIYVSSDIPEAPAQVNSNTVIDNAGSVNFEIVIDTSIYDDTNELPL